MHLQLDQELASLINEIRIRRAPFHRLLATRVVVYYAQEVVKLVLFTSTSFHGHDDVQSFLYIVYR